MTEKEFFKLLPKTGWKLTKNSEMRRRIKGRPADYCPVTAVAHRKTGEFFDIGRYMSAAFAMELSPAFADTVAVSADCVDNTDPLRKKLLKHTRLKEWAA